MIHISYVRTQKPEKLRNLPKVTRSTAGLEPSYLSLLGLLFLQCEPWESMIKCSDGPHLSHPGSLQALPDTSQAWGSR